ncbi:MAG: M48 family metallopeptidase [Nitrospira sp.]|nr:M48 family metallopeptidase [Nitrospira sp.]
MALTSCQTVPLTGRSQLILISDQDELALGQQSYQKVLKESKLSQDPKINEMVRRVGMKLAQVADRPDYKWEFTVIEDDKMVNAFCLPGGKVAVYTGILPITRDEAGLAVVLSHEIGHAIARHGAERISTQELAKIGELGLIVALGGKDPQTVKAVDAAYGIGTGVGIILPFSRKHESEADHIGLILMAKAGYDPQTAVEFWQRMLEAKKDKKAPPEFLSTHPSDERRIQQIKQWLPEVSQYRQTPVLRAP